MFSLPSVTASRPSQMKSAWFVFPFLKTSKIKRKLMVPLSNLSPLELYPFDWFYRLIDVIEAIGELTPIRYHSIGYVFFSGFRWSFRQIDVGIFHLPVTLVWKTYIPDFSNMGISKMINAVDLEPEIQKSTTQILLFGIHSPNFFLGEVWNKNMVRAKWPLIYNPGLMAGIHPAPFQRVSYRAGGRFLCVFGGSYSELKGEVDLGFSWNQLVVSGWSFQGAFLDYLNMNNYLNDSTCCVFSRILVWMAFGKFQSDQNLKVSLM